MTQQTPLITIFKDEKNSISIQTEKDANILEVVGTLTAAQKLYLDQVYSVNNTNEG